MRLHHIIRSTVASLSIAVMVSAGAFSSVATAQGTAPGTTTGRYVALGDSVAAGLGLPAGNYTTARDAQCGRSDQGYPAIVAARRSKQLVNAACSGATAGDLVTKQAVDGPNIPAQLDTAFASGTPGLITITAGANDVHWSNFIRACYISDCTASAYSTAAKTYTLALRAKLAYAFADIYARSNGTPPRVVVTGYYMPLSNACLAQQQNITNAELTWLTSETAMLNSAIQTVAANYSFVSYAPVSFAGHDICSATPWIQTQSGAAPFHPTAHGQQVMAQAVLDALDR